MPPLLFSRLRGLTTHSLAPLATPHAGLSIRQSRLPGPTCSTTPCLSMDGARTSPSAKDTLVKIYELEGHLDFSEGVVFRLQWSWDLKMCPYWRGALILEGTMFRLQWSWDTYVCVQVPFGGASQCVCAKSCHNWLGPNCNWF